MNIQDDLQVSVETWHRYMLSNVMRWGEYVLVVTPDQPPIAVSREGRWETLHLAEGDDLLADAEWVTVAQHQATSLFEWTDGHQRSAPRP